jgi:hypothetical protein
MAQFITFADALSIVDACGGTYSQAETESRFGEGYTAALDAAEEALKRAAGEHRPFEAWVLQRNDFPHAVYLHEASARAECERQREEERYWREENKHVADVKVFWNVYPVLSPLEASVSTPSQMGGN